MFSSTFFLRLVYRRTWQGGAPDVTYQDIGSMDAQEQEIPEAVEVPLTHFDLPSRRGVLLYGSPGLSSHVRICSSVLIF